MGIETGENRERGASFVELMVAIAIVGMALMVMLSQISISFREASMNEHRAFGYRKAMAILTEIHKIAKHQYFTGEELKQSFISLMRLLISFNNEAL